jgi:hypothetical protein
MQDAKFSLEQAWSAQLMFFDSLMRLKGNRIKADPIPVGDFSALAANLCLSEVSIGAFFASLHMDKECFEEWCFFYQKILKKPFEKALLSSESALLLMIEFVSYFRCRLGLKISLLLDLVQGMKFHPFESDKPLTLWYRALQRAADGELWIQRDQKALLPFVGNFQVQYQQTFEIAGIFLWQVGTEFYSISAEVKERTESFLGFLSGGDFGEEREWETCYIKTCGRPLSSRTMLSSAELFSTTITFTAWYCYQFGYSAFELMALLNMMRCKPDLYETKWRLWRQTIQDVFDGKYKIEKQKSFLFYGRQYSD